MIRNFDFSDVKKFYIFSNINYYFKDARI